MTERQEDILETLVRRYITSAEPVSSFDLEESFDVSPATIRNELQTLSEDGYVFQPHISSGRVPSDKGYRFFVSLVEKKEEAAEFDHLERSLQHGLEQALEEIADLSSALVLGMTGTRKAMWKIGWEDVLEEPEFEKREAVVGLTRFLGDIEEKIHAFRRKGDVHVFIGRENPFSEVEDFSIIASRGDSSFVAIVGPKRMAYDRNIMVMRAVRTYMQEV